MIHYITRVNYQINLGIECAITETLEPWNFQRVQQSEK